MIERFNEENLYRFARKDLNEAVKKVNKAKQKKKQAQVVQKGNLTMTGQRPEFINLEPDKPDIIGAGRLTN